MLISQYNKTFLLYLLVLSTGDWDVKLCLFVSQALADLGWSQPTLIQEKAIPLALEGKDLLARARTGSGKTAAYAIPLIQRILTSKQVTLGFELF